MPDTQLVLLDSADAAVTLPYERAFRLVTDAPHIIRLRQDPGALFETPDAPSRLSPYSTAYLIPRLAENVRVEGTGSVGCGGAYHSLYDRPGTTAVA